MWIFLHPHICDICARVIFFFNKLHVELLKNNANIYCAALIWIAGTFCNINGLFDRFEILLTHIIPHWFLFITENNTLQRPQDILEDKIGLHNQNLFIDNQIDIWCWGQLKHPYNLHRICIGSMLNNFA